MAYSPDIKAKARRYYVINRMNAKMIAFELKCPASTVQRWKTVAKKSGDDWDKARQASMMAGDGINDTVGKVVEDFVVMTEKVMENIKASDDELVDKQVQMLTSLADAMVKMTNAASRIAPKISELGVAQDVLRRLLEFVRDEFPHHGNAMQEILEPFGEHLSRAYE